jgi:centrin-3
LRALGFEVKKQEVQALMKEFDREETGRIEYSDYIELSKPLNSNLSDKKIL